MSDELPGLPPVHTPEQGRDLIVECFFQAQREKFRATADKLRVEVNDEFVRSQVTGSVMLAFGTVRVDYERPTKAGLLKVVQVLQAKAALLGTPPAIIAGHTATILRALASIPDEDEAAAVSPA